jgi:hypothetical protein
LLRGAMIRRCRSGAPDNVVIESILKVNYLTETWP